MAVEKDYEIPGVFIKPLVRNELDMYVDGYGNDRDYRKYNKSLNVKDLQIIPTKGSEGLPSSSVTFRSYVKSEYERDENNSFGVPKNKILKSGRFKSGAKKPAKQLKHVWYLVSIRFHGLKFVPEKTPTYKTEWKIGANSYFSRPIAIDKNPVMMRCNCRDFSITWEKPVADGGGLYPNNKWSKYVPVPGSDREPRNPFEKMGYCKHIQTFLQFLYDSELIRNK